MDRDDNYFSGLARSWCIPGFVLLAVGTHVIVEAIVYHGYRRGSFILLSFCLLPFVVSTFVRRRKAFFGAFINLTYILLSIHAYASALHLCLTYRDLRDFLILIAFALISGAITGNFQQRLCNGFRNNQYRPAPHTN